MRSLVEGTTNELVLIDGVKELTEQGWILTIPDPEDPTTHVWTEADCEENAQDLARRQGQRILKLLRSGTE